MTTSLTGSYFGVAELGIDVGSELVRAARRLDRHYLAPRYPNRWAEGAPVDYYDEEEAEEALREAEGHSGGS